ncbi:SGNH/GDSL hydrolase family protein [Lacihabitans sp. LS3-19]|uniref:SGNH/GDSL hydrolase family protein n=1 Tax=Lacihabitans sp. LS3-19 TaxID=2487335 RepID=UPI0020CCE431|nr:SGNH/GDSL hydrolase family protein [Lacihabitans sp. LS3-19]
MKYTLAFLLFSFQILIAQKTIPNASRTEDWKGFEQEHFKFEGREAWIKLPKNAKSNKPWVWRAHFPDWHTSIDSILLERGFHIAYINTNDMFGSPEAMQIWDDFYDYLTKEKQFAPKVALEGVSRGGLYIYAWAKRNPLKVSCIYAEAPVCDFKSWPMKHGSQADKEVLFKSYDFNEATALKYTDNPLNNLNGLAACGVPILHAICLEDSIVPNEENTFRLVENYIKLGGKVTVWPMTKGEKKLNGHHFDIENPFGIADFIESNSLLNASVLPSTKYHSFGGGLQNSFLKFKNGGTAKVAFLGGSITENPGWRDKVSQFLSEKFPQTKFEFINAGISSTGSTPGAFRLEKDVLSKGKIDLLFEEAAVNDFTNGFNAEAQIRGMEGIVRHALLENPLMDIVMMHFVDPEKMAEYNAGKVPEVIQNHNKVAAAYNLGVINLAQEVTERIKAGEFNWKDDFKNLHPSTFGQEVYFRSIKDFLNAQFVDTETMPKLHELPEPVDAFSYFGGKEMSIKNASKLKNWEIQEAWNPNDNVSTRKQFVNIPALISTSAGASFSLDFKGKAIGICIASGPDAGILEYKIDGKKYSPLDLYTQWSSFLHLPWYLMFDDELKDKKHKLEVTISNNKNPKSQGTACRIFYFLVNE